LEKGSPRALCKELWLNRTNMELWYRLAVVDLLVVVLKNQLLMDQLLILILLLLVSLNRIFFITVILGGFNAAVALKNLQQHD
jgi:hypothetical protein